MFVWSSKFMLTLIVHDMSGNIGIRPPAGPKVPLCTNLRNTFLAD